MFDVHTTNLMLQAILLL